MGPRAAVNVVAKKEKYCPAENLIPIIQPIA
jgi:hypothetical protein